jgi:hypothetical protein
LNNSDVADKTEAEAWGFLKSASDDRDLDDFKDAVKILIKSAPDYTYPRLEQEFRDRGFKIHIIAMEKPIGDTWTNVDLQGEIGKKFVVGYYFSDKPQRPNLVDKWPTSSEENMERLADAGVPMNRGVDKCNNWYVDWQMCQSIANENSGELGHVHRKCPQDIIPVDRVTVTCALCSQEGGFF